MSASRDIYRPTIVAFSVAILLRLGWVIFRSLQTGPELSYPDEALHWSLAHNLVHAGSLVSDDGRYAARMPLYPLFLALFAWLGDSGIVVARLFQALLGALTAAVAARFAAAALGRRAAWAAGLLVAVDPFNIFFCHLLLTEVLFTLLALVFVTAGWQLTHADRIRRRNTTIAAFALSGALALLTRPSAVLWLPAAWLLLLLFAYRRDRALAAIAVALLTLAAGLGPWGLRNIAVLGAPAWLSTNGGVTLYDAQGPQARGDSDQSFLKDMPKLRGMGELERDAYLRDLAIAQMKKDPERVIKLAGIKFLRMWNPVPNVAEHRRGLTALVSAAYTIPVLIAAIAGLARAYSRCRLFHLWIWLPVVYFTLLHMVFVGSVRYRIPLMPLLALAAASLLFMRQARHSADDGRAS